MTARGLDAWLTPDRRRFVRFCVVGASGVVVNLGCVAIGMWAFSTLGFEERWQEFWASALGIAISVLTNFLLNDLWTWGDRAKGTRKRDYAARMGLYYVASAAAIGLQFGVAQLLAQTLDVNIYAAQMAGIALGTFVNYAANNRWTFRDKA